MSFFLILIGVMVLGDFAWWLAARRMLRAADPRPRNLAVLNGLFILLQVIGLGLVLFTRRSGFGFRLPVFIPSMVYLWHLLFVPLLLTAIVGWAIVAIAVRLIRLFAARGAALEPVQSVGPGLNRRAFLLTSAALTPPLFNLSLAAIGMSQLDDFRIRRFVIPIHELPIALDGMTVAQVSDLHVGCFTNGAVLRRIAAEVNDLRADLIVLTGDLINNSLGDLAEGIEIVRRMDAPSGVFMIEGNHDLFEGREEFERRVKASGVPLLLNEMLDLQIRDHPVELLGLRWGSLGAHGQFAYGDNAIRSSMSELMRLRNPEMFPILLAHHPHAFDLAVEARLPLTLAGHTHGGQLMFTPEAGFGPWIFRYWSGLYQKDASNLVVSNGVGNWFPLRTNAPAEVVHITLRRA